MSHTVIQEMLLEEQKRDAQAVYKDMQSPTLMRLRADALNKDEHPLLGMRLSLMASRRERLKELAQLLIEDGMPLENEVQIAKLAKDIRAAQESCIRVLECSDDPQVKQSVEAAARGMGGSIETMASVLLAKGNVLGRAVQGEADAARRVADSVDALAEQMKNEYAQLRLAIVYEGFSMPRQNASPHSVPSMTSG
jgi:hypothetical protein